MMLTLSSLLSGIVGGMGIGGGVILIPVLTNFFGVSQKNAQFINLIYFVPLALCALYVHIREGRVEMKKAIYMALGGIVGAFLGSEITSRISVSVLRKFFGAFLLFIGINGLRKKDDTDE